MLLHQPLVKRLFWAIRFYRLRLIYVLRISVALLITALAIFFTWRLFTGIETKISAPSSDAHSLSAIGILITLGVFGPLSAYLVLFYVAATARNMIRISQAFGQLRQPEGRELHFPRWLSRLLIALMLGVLSVWFDDVMMSQTELFTISTLLLVVGMTLLWSFVILAFGLIPVASQKESLIILFAPCLGATLFGLCLISGIQIFPFHDQIEHLLALIASNLETLTVWSFVILAVWVFDEVWLTQANENYRGART